MFKHGFPPEWSTFKKLIWLVGSGIAGDASGIWKTVTGTLIHITNALASPMQKCEVSLEPIQDLHGQDAPYPAGGGKQLLNPNTFASFPKTQYGITATLNADGTISLSGTATQTTYITIINYKMLSSYGIFEADTDYMLSGYVESGVYVGFGVYGSGTDYWDSSGSGRTISFTAEEIASKQYRLIILVYNGKTLSNVVIKPMICLASATNPTTFAPYENVCPITGWTGCEVNVDGTNLWDDSITPETIQAYAINGTPVTVTGRNLYLKSGTYTFSFTGEAGSNYIYGNVCNSDGSWVSTFRLTTPIPQICTITLGQGQFAKLFVASGSTTLLTSGNIQLEVGSSATPYKPFNGTTLSVTFPDSTGTVYGGTVDLVSGVLTVTEGITTLPSSGWTYYQTGGKKTFNTTVNGAKAHGNGLCEIYSFVNVQYINQQPDKTFMFYNASPETKISICDNDYSDAATFGIMVGGKQLVYELAEPIEIQLTPQQISTLKGVNNVWSNGNSVEITYKAQAE